MEHTANNKINKTNRNNTHTPMTKLPYALSANMIEGKRSLSPSSVSPSPLFKKPKFDRITDLSQTVYTPMYINTNEEIVDKSILTFCLGVPQFMKSFELFTNDMMYLDLQNDKNNKSNKYDTNLNKNNNYNKQNANMNINLKTFISKLCKRKIKKSDGIDKLIDTMDVLLKNRNVKLNEWFKFLEQNKEIKEYFCSQLNAYLDLMIQENRKKTSYLQSIRGKITYLPNWLSISIVFFSLFLSLDMMWLNNGFSTGTGLSQDILAKFVKNKLDNDKVIIYEYLSVILKYLSGVLVYSFNMIKSLFGMSYGNHFQLDNQISSISYYLLEMAKNTIDVLYGYDIIERTEPGKYFGDWWLQTSYRLVPTGLLSRLSYTIRSSTESVVSLLMNYTTSKVQDPSSNLLTQSLFYLGFYYIPYVITGIPTIINLIGYAIQKFFKQTEKFKENQRILDLTLNYMEQFPILQSMKKDDIESFLQQFKNYTDDTDTVLDELKKFK